MSKIGKKPITIPQGVEVKINGDLISVKGPKGTLERAIFKDVVIAVEGNEIKIKLAENPSKEGKVFWGLTRALVQNMVTGVTTGFETVLEFQGVGYKAAAKGANLEMGLGFSHPVTIEGAEGITFVTDKSSIKIQGIDKELIGKIAAKIRMHRLPEPYKGSGIRYQGEVIKRKAGKKAATAA
ncbi:MAG: 50S ribosomal protein L6 [Candidatus Pacebacteria bacterium]|nr:50S ribosomal protein L6 [Candidatus Paceibacterota bacterium]